MFARAGVIAALYVALTYAVFPVASGNIQFRVSEMLTVLPLFYVEAVPALLVGCLISNLMTGSVIDIVFGSLITLVAAGATYFTGRILKNSVARVAVGGIFPVVLNALGLPLLWFWASGSWDVYYWLNVGYLMISQGVIVWGLGSVLYSIFNALTKKEISFLKPVSLHREEK